MMDGVGADSMCSDSENLGRRPGRRGRRAGVGGFTLVELLVVVGILSTLLAIIVPPLAMAREIAAKGICKANIRLLQQGNEVYQREHGGFYAPAAPHMYPVPGSRDYSMVNMIRWFGSRESLTEPFGMSGGPLSPYLPSQVVKGCPGFDDYLVGFEAGCGGYGYNSNFVGQHIIPYRGRYLTIGPAWHLSGNHATRFRYPDRTVAFTDTAFVHEGLMEYPFCESPTWPLFGSEPRPSIHFRHLGKANVAWLDTHVSEERMTFTNEVQTGNPYIGSPRAYDVGWFGPKNNTLFDCD
jgi:prepilin-type processing-associated H-X9-DG protein/prepilin-type N-terminal cleavage/methylation domain-containing protein